MNKAFVREPDQTVERCPRCGSVGQAVGRETLQAHLPDDFREQLAESASFCPLPHCDVAYFDMFERSVSTKSLMQPVFPKDPQAPICACFGLTCDDIDADIQEGVVTRVKALIQRAESDEARCSANAANGQSCVPDVQRYYMQHRGNP